MKKTQARNVTLLPQDWRDIETVAAVTNSRNISAALRQIIQEWRTIRQMYYEGQLKRQQGGCHAETTGNGNSQSTVLRDLQTLTGNQTAEEATCAR